MSTTARLLSLSLALVAATPPLAASISGPVPARTGGFGEMTCHQCHWDNPVNDLAGKLSFEDLPSSYTPGSRYLITLRVSHPELTRAGFQLAIRSEDGRSAGTLEPLDARATTAAHTADSTQYLQHTEGGTNPQTEHEAAWRFVWVAPAAPVVVVMHVAANAANGDASPLGDYVFTATAAVRP